MFSTLLESDFVTQHYVVAKVKVWLREERLKKTHKAII